MVVREFSRRDFGRFIFPGHRVMCFWVEQLDELWNAMSHMFHHATEFVLVNKFKCTDAQ